MIGGVMNISGDKMAIKIPSKEPKYFIAATTNDNS